MADTPKWWWTLNSIWALAVTWAWLNYVTEWKVISALTSVKDAVAAILSWESVVIPSLAKAVPIAWKLAPFAWIWAWGYYWYKKYKDIKTETWSTMKWLYRWVERWTMVSWVTLALLSTVWLSIPIAPAVLMTWLWLKWVRHLHNLVLNSVSTIWKAPSYLSSLPKKALNGVKKLKPWKKSWSSPNPAPTTTPSNP